jgi:prepilin-type N-terminal cleavage/methylation domain-containing protein
MMTRLERMRRRDDRGMTLIEMMVSTLIFSIILAIITTVIVSMFKQEQKETGQTNDLDSSRKVVETLDHSTRYASAITTPVLAADGNYYVEWETGNIGQQQSCTQWRYVPSTKALQSRSWYASPYISPVTGPATTSWTTQAKGISQVGANPVFALGATTGALGPGGPSAQTKQQLSVSFNTTSGTPASTSASQVTLTAINSTSASAPTGSAVLCAQAGP